MIYIYYLSIYKLLSISMLILLFSIYVMGSKTKKVKVYFLFCIFFVVIGTISLINNLIVHFICKIFEFTSSIYLNEELSKYSNTSIKVLSIYILYVFSTLLLSIVFLFILR